MASALTPRIAHVRDVRAPVEPAEVPGIAPGDPWERLRAQNLVQGVVRRDVPANALGRRFEALQEPVHARTELFGHDGAENVRAIVQDRLCGLCTSATEMEAFVPDPDGPQPDIADVAPVTACVSHR
jgi:hypothetical protein